MPPRRSARVAAVAERATSALSPLPLSVVLHIFSLLPVDCRLRCSEVCRGWRAVLLERSLWTRLDVTAASGGVVVREDANFGALNDGLLRCAAARAGGGLESLHVNRRLVTHAALLEVAAANAGALRELHAHSDEPYREVAVYEAEPLCGAAPLLRTFSTDLYGDITRMQAVRRALRNEAPFGPLRVRRLNIDLDGVNEAGIVAFAADVAAHASLCGLKLLLARLSTPAALNAVVDAALLRCMRSVTFAVCFLSPASVPALARLLGGGALAKLLVTGANLVNAPAARVLAAALRANSTLMSLTLDNTGVWSDLDAAAELLGALTGHASLRVLHLGGNRVDAAHQAAAGALLGALVAANAPALTELDVSFCDLDDDGLRALFEALPRNTHLRTLVCTRNDISDAFAADVLLPAVRASTSLRELDVDEHGESPHVDEAMQLVRDRE
jgi:hypothetical protein